MKTNTIKILPLLFVVLSHSACKDFFDISNPQTLSQDNFPATIEQVDQLLTSAYSGSHSIGMYAFYWFPMGIYLYDHTTDTYGSYDERATSMDNYTDIDSRYITTTYTDLCKWIRLSTVAIDGIDRYQNRYATAGEKETLDYMRGQALFNRALAYWHAQIFFEMDADAWGFPLIDRVISDVEELKLRRATVRDTWQFMINDFKAACTLLEGHNDTYRATEWAAKGMLTKAYMQSLYIFPENKEAAKTLIEDIINNSGKSLVAADIYRDMFYGNAANEHNSESLYELTMTVNPNQNGPWENYTTGSGMAMVYAPWYMDLDIRFRAGREDKIDPITLEHDITTCKKSSEWGNNFVHDRNIARFGFWDFYGDTVPRQTLNPDYDFNAPRSVANYPYRLHNSVYRTEALARKNNPDKVDPRLMLCAGQPFVDIYIDASGRETYYDRSTEVNNRPDIIGWQHRKYTNTRGVEMGGGDYGKNQSSDCNIHIVRLADIYLLYAELLKDDAPSTALEYVNKVHRRAYGYAPDEASPYDYQTLTDRTRTFDETDHLAYDVIRYERWAELFAEGQWWYDVRRYRIGPAEAAYYQTTRHGAITWKGDASYVQPIPQLELERNGNIQQSDGYPHL